MSVSTAWHSPAGPPKGGLVLAHGAGGDFNNALLVAIGEGLKEHGIATLRFNFAYSEAGRRAPDRMPVLQATYAEVADAAAKEVQPLYIGGKSLGGRVASMIAADGYACAGLVFVGYPLHPPGKPERIRDEHLARIEAPMLFLAGTRDPFATPELLHATISKLPRARLVQIDGGDHSFRVPGRKPAEVTAELVGHIAAFIH